MMQRRTRPDRTITVSMVPRVIEEAEQYTAVFRTNEKRDLFTKLSLRHPLGYYIMSGSSEHCRQYIHLYFSEYGYRYITPQSAKLGFTYSYISLNRKLGKVGRERRLYDVKCLNKNILDIEDLRVALLSKQAIAKCPAFIPFLSPTINFNDKFNYENGVYIVKTDGIESYAGKGNFLVSSLDEWNIVKQKVLDLVAEEKIDGATISKYIDNPLLDSRGHKTHFRCYVMITNRGIHTPADFWMQVTAAKPYIKADYQNPEIHDTHFKSTPTINIWTEKTNKKVTEGILRILNVITTEISKYDVKTYLETRNGYQILAPDILFDDEYNAYLLEINTTPLLGSLEKKGIDRYETMFSTWEFAYGIEPLLVEQALFINPGDKVLNEKDSLIIHYPQWLEKQFSRTKSKYTMDELHEILVNGLPFSTSKIANYNGVEEDYFKIDNWGNAEPPILGLKDVRDAIAFQMRKALTKVKVVRYYSGNDMSCYRPCLDVECFVLTGDGRDIYFKDENRRIVQVYLEPGDLLFVKANKWKVSIPKRISCDTILMTYS